MFFVLSLRWILCNSREWRNCARYIRLNTNYMRIEFQCKLAMLVLSFCQCSVFYSPRWCVYWKIFKTQKHQNQSDLYIYQHKIKLNLTWDVAINQSRFEIFFSKLFSIFITSSFLCTENIPSDDKLSDYQTQFTHFKVEFQTHSLADVHADCVNKAIQSKSKTFKKINNGY